MTRGFVCIRLALFTAVLVTGQRGTCGDPLDDVLTKLDRSAAGFKGMSADLTQTAHTAVINEDQVESGNIRMKRSKLEDTRMLVTFLKPDQKTVQLQGHTLDIYLPSSQSEEEYSLGKNSALIEQFLLLGFGTTRADLESANEISYLGAETVNGHAAAHLQLIPKSKDVLTHIKKIELWLSPDTGNPLQHKIFQPGGDYQLFVFSNLKMNPADLSDASMKIKAPRNVRIEKH